MEKGRMHGLKKGQKTQSTERAIQPIGRELSPKEAASGRKEGS